jgi:hypothetical protein
MSNYTKATNFATKDTLPTGDANKIVKGTEIDNEFNAISGAVSSKADIASPTFTGTPAAPTATAGSNTTQLANTAYVKAEITAQGLGNMATQAKTAVDITGGTITGVAITGITDLIVADGGTGRSTLTDKAVLIGAGTGAINSVAPGTAGNTLTSDGTNWASTAPPFTKSAWLYYDGAIVSSNNIASVTNPGTGLYTVTFTAAFSDANYIVIGTGQANSAATTPGTVAVNQTSVSKAAGSIQIQRSRTDSGAAENGAFYVYFFGT